jgi:hypothetical protein
MSCSCRVAVALRKANTVFTLQKMFEVVQSCFTPNPVCELLEMINDWESMFSNINPEDPIQQEVELTGFNYQFKIQRNANRDVVVYGKQFAETGEWTAMGSDGEPIDGVVTLLRTPDTDAPPPCSLIPLDNNDFQALKNVVIVMEKNYGYVQSQPKP